MLARTLAAVLLVTSCTPKEPRGDEALKNVAELEARIAQLEKAQPREAQAPDLGPVLDQIEELTLRVLKLESVKLAGPPRRHEPDKGATYAVPIAGSPTYGGPKAKVTIVMAMDFACPYCRKAWTTVDDLRAKYGADLRVVYKAMIVHPQVATHAALAACAANHQGKFKELAELLWSKSFDTRDFADATVDNLAVEAKLDSVKFQRDLTGACAQEVKDEQAQLTKLGVGATPSFFINGRFMAGAQPQPEFEKLIDEELAKATAAIKSGVKPEKYYDQEILAKGLKELAPATP